MTIATTDLKPARTRKVKPARPGIDTPLTYEEYLNGEEEMARYDIVDGLKVYYKWGIQQLPSPTRDHQQVLMNIADAFRAFQRNSRAGKTVIAPCDVLIHRRPLRTRQPDVLFISQDRWLSNPPSNVPGVLEPAPELVVEILSPSDTRRVRQSKINDYKSVGVQECWLVSMEAETVELLRLSDAAVESVDVYGHGQTVASLAFAGLTVAVDDVFAE